MDDSTILFHIKENDLSFLKSIPLDYQFTDKTYLIHQACLYNNFDLALIILTNKKEHLNIKGGKHDSTPLYFSIYNLSVDVTFILLEMGVNVNCLNSTGLPILHSCIKFDNILAFILLINHGVHFKTLDTKNRTFWEYAIIKNKYRFIEVIKKSQKNKLLFIEDKRLVQNDDNSFIVYSILVIYVMLFFSFPTITLFLAIYIIFTQNRRLLRTNIYVFLNLFYSTYYFMNLISFSYYFVIFFVIYLIIVFKLFKKQKHTSQMFDKKLVQKLVYKEQFNVNHYCYICWIEKEYNTVHCHICQTCIHNFDHHCKFVNNCIDSRNLKIFNVYLFYTFFLLIFLGWTDLEMGFILHYRIIFVFLLIQLFNRLIFFRK